MPVKVFTATTLPASDINTFLMDQAVVTCTSGTRPTVVEGRVIYETDTDSIRVYNGTTWSLVWRLGATYTPTLVGMAVGTVGNINTASWVFSGGILSVTGSIVFGSTAPTFPAATITASLPAGFTAVGTTPFTRVGDVTFFDTTSGGTSDGTIRLQSTTTVRFMSYNTSTTYGFADVTSTTIPFTWAAGDAIYWRATIQGSF